jgi:hypothetical protein
LNLDGKAQELSVLGTLCGRDVRAPSIKSPVESKLNQHPKGLKATVHLVN